MSTQDLILIGLIVTSIASLIAAIQATRNGNKEALTKYVTAKTSDVELTTILEQRFARLSPTAQESIMKLIRVADPLTDYWPGDLDNHVVNWVKEISDAVPVKDKPVITADMAHG